MCKGSQLKVYKVRFRLSIKIVGVQPGIFLIFLLGYKMEIMSCQKVLILHFQLNYTRLLLLKIKTKMIKFNKKMKNSKVKKKMGKNKTKNKEERKKSKNKNKSNELLLFQLICISSVILLNIMASR